MTREEIVKRIEFLENEIKLTPCMDPKDAYDINHWRKEIDELQKRLKLIDFVSWITYEANWEFKRGGYIEEDKLHEHSSIDLQCERSYADCIYDQATIYFPEMTISGFRHDIGWGYTNTESFDMTFEEFKNYFETL